MPRKIILRSFQSPGDVLMLTAAVRDLHLANPGQYLTDVRTSAPALWENNPHLTPLNEREPGVETIDCHYPLIHQSNERPFHFIHGYAQFLEERLGVKIPVTRFAGDIHLSADEKRRPLPFADLGLHENFWIVMAGGKHDFTAKWWDPASYQAVIDRFQGRIQFAQCGEAGHCEGSEFSILENTRVLDRIGLIAGDYHGRERFLRLVSRRFADWQLKVLRDADPGTFWLINPRTLGYVLSPNFYDPTP